MPEMNIAQLKAYAKEHFPDDFAKLPPIKCTLDLFGNFKRSILFFEDEATARVVQYCPGLVSYFHSPSLKQLEPFCWLDPGRHNNIDAKMNAVILYCFLEKTPDLALDCTRSLLGNFSLACADIADVVRAQEAAVDGPSKWGITAAGQYQVQKVSS